MQVCILRTCCKCIVRNKYITRTTDFFCLSVCITGTQKVGAQCHQVSRMPSPCRQPRSIFCHARDTLSLGTRLDRGQCWLSANQHVQACEHMSRSYKWQHAATRSYSALFLRWPSLRLLTCVGNEFLSGIGACYQRSVSVVSHISQNQSASALMWSHPTFMCVYERERKRERDREKKRASERERKKASERERKIKCERERARKHASTRRDKTQCCRCRCFARSINHAGSHRWAHGALWQISFAFMYCRNQRGGCRVLPSSNMRKRVWRCHTTSRNYWLRGITARETCSRAVIPLPKNLSRKIAHFLSQKLVLRPPLELLYDLIVAHMLYEHKEHLLVFISKV